MGVTVGLVAAGAAISATGSVAEGFLQADAIGRQAEAEADAATRAAKGFARESRLSQTQARQEEAGRRTELSRLLATQRAQAAAQGVSGASLIAIQGETRRVAGRDIQNIRLLGASERRKFGFAAEDAAKSANDLLNNAGRAQKISVAGGILGAGTSLFTAGAGLALAGTFDQTPGGSGLATTSLGVPDFRRAGASGS